MTDDERRALEWLDGWAKVPGILGEAPRAISRMLNVSADPSRLVEIAVKAAAEWLMSDDSAYEQSPEDAYRVAREMLRVANEAYQGHQLINVDPRGTA